MFVNSQTELIVLNLSNKITFYIETFTWNKELKE